MSILLKSKSRVFLLRDGPGGEMKEVGPQAGVRFDKLKAVDFEHDADLELVAVKSEPKLKKPEPPAEEPKKKVFRRKSKV